MGDSEDVGPKGQQLLEDLERAKINFQTVQCYRNANDVLKVMKCPQYSQRDFHLIINFLTERHG